MHTQPNARLTPLRREGLLSRHIVHVDPLAPLAAQAGISFSTAYKWFARYRSGGQTFLADPRSVRRTQRRILDPHWLYLSVDLRCQCCTCRRIFNADDAPLPTVGRVIEHLGPGR